MTITKNLTVDTTINKSDSKNTASTSAHSVQVRGARVHNLKMSMWIYPAMHWSFLLVYQAQANRHSLLALCLLSHSAAIWIQCPLMRVD